MPPVNGPLFWDTVYIPAGEESAGAVLAMSLLGLPASQRSVAPTTLELLPTTGSSQARKRERRSVVTSRGVNIRISQVYRLSNCRCQ